MAGYRRSRSTRRRKGGRYLWIPATVPQALMTPGQIIITELTPTAVIEDTVLVGCTIRRVVGSISLRSGTSDADATLITSVYTQTREAKASAVVPNPETDIYPFMWTNSTLVRLGDQPSNASQFTNIPLNVRVSRRMRQNDTLILQRYNPSSINLVAGFFSRVLVYIP